MIYKSLLHTQRERERVFLTDSTRKDKLAHRYHQKRKERRREGELVSSTTKGRNWLNNQRKELEAKRVRRRITKLASQLDLGENNTHNAKSVRRTMGYELNMVLYCTHTGRS
jgi:hypothetical protein